MQLAHAASARPSVLLRDMMTEVPALTLAGVGLSAIIALGHEHGPRRISRLVAHLVPPATTKQQQQQQQQLKHAFSAGEAAEVCKLLMRNGPLYTT